MGLAAAMTVAVQFNDQHRIAAGEVGNIGADDFLAAELHALKAFGAQGKPEARFRWGLLEAKGFGAVESDLVAHFPERFPLSGCQSPLPAPLP